MIVRVDEKLCVGHGRCYALAPDVFGADDYGHCVILRAEMADDDPLTASARAGADACPERAIQIEG